MWWRKHELQQMKRSVVGRVFHLMRERDISSKDALRLMIQIETDMLEFEDDEVMYGI
jgi:hypothetical protein